MHRMHNIVAYILLIGVAAVAETRKLKKYLECEIEEGVIVGQMDDKIMEEASGLAYSNINDGILWTMNDHGDDPRVIAISEEGERVAIVTLDEVLNTDWEDIAVTKQGGESKVLVADTGNNDFDRETLSIFRFKEPTLTGNKRLTIPRDEIEDLKVRYPTGSYDCEALTEDQTTGDIFLFTKDRKKRISQVFRYPAPQSEANNPFTLEQVGTLPLIWITGGDMSPDGRTLALTNKKQAFRYSKPGGLSWTDFLGNNPEPCNLPLEKEVQREAIAVTMEGYWTTSECKKDPPCPLWFYALSPDCAKKTNAAKKKGSKKNDSDSDEDSSEEESNENLK